MPDVGALTVVAGQRGLRQARPELVHDRTEGKKHNAAAPGPRARRHAVCVGGPGRDRPGWAATAAAAARARQHGGISSPCSSTGPGGGSSRAVRCPCCAGREPAAGRVRGDVLRGGLGQARWVGPGRLARISPDGFPRPARRAPVRLSHASTLTFQAGGCLARPRRAACQADTDSGNGNAWWLSFAAPYVRCRSHPQRHYRPGMSGDLTTEQTVRLLCDNIQERFRFIVNYRTGFLRCHVLWAAPGCARERAPSAIPRSPGPPVLAGRASPGC